MEELDLVDIYQKLHPNTKAFMYLLTPLTTKSWINTKTLEVRGFFGK